MSVLGVELSRVWATGYFLRCRVPDIGSYTVTLSDVQIGGDAVQVIAVDVVAGGELSFDP